MSEIKLGSRVKDVYTGFAGIAIGRSEWLYGCARFLVEPFDLDKDGKVREAVWFDEQRVELLQEQPPINTTGGINPGGPSQEAHRTQDPTR